MTAPDRSTQPLDARHKVCVHCGTFVGLGSRTASKRGLCPPCIEKSREEKRISRPPAPLPMGPGLSSSPGPAKAGEYFTKVRP